MKRVILVVLCVAILSQLSLLPLRAQQPLTLSDCRRMAIEHSETMRKADENLRQMRQRYDAQMATMTDLLDAQSQWQQARSNLIEAQTQQKLYETEYLRVTGRLE